MPSKIAPELAELARRASDGGLDLSAVSLRVQADLLMGMAEPPADGLAMFEEMAVALLPEVDVETATVLARKLAGWAHTPPSVIACLRMLGEPVIAALIAHGGPLNDADIDSFAADGSEMLAVALAARTELSTSAVILLTGRGERSVDLALAANLAAPLPPAALDLMLARAANDPAYAPLLLKRADLAGAELTPLFLQAGADRRRAMLDSLRMIEGLDPSRGMPRIDADAFETLLTLAGTDRSGALGALADKLGGGSRLAEALRADTGRELGAIALAAGGASPEEATRFLIRLGDEAARSVGQIFAIVALLRELTQPVALRLLEQIVGGTELREAAKPRPLQPLMDPSTSPTRVGQPRREGRSVLDEVRKGLGLKA